jgi:Na+-transporting NADH:ubiquinone oxidoreductase subunit NqrB
MRALGLQRKGLLSAVITCFGLSILLRADSLWVHPLAAALAISSKFALRVGGKHVFNPANFGVVAATVALPGAWVSPGQWGHDVALAGWFVVLGSLVTERARRWDIAWTFLVAWLGAVAARVIAFAQPIAVFAHQLDNGALLLFAFFMISDPMTIPDRRGMRIAYALAVATIAFAWQYALFKPNAFVWALFVASPFVPLIDRLRPGARFDWRAAH